jgi:hypothetical protein
VIHIKQKKAGKTGWFIRLALEHTLLMNSNLMNIITFKKFDNYYGEKAPVDAIKYIVVPENPVKIDIKKNMRRS